MMSYDNGGHLPSGALRLRNGTGQPVPAVLRPAEWAALDAGTIRQSRESDSRPRFAMDADLTVYWPWVRSCWEDDRACR